MNKQKQKISTYDVSKKTRKDWGNISPVTKVQNSKKGNAKHERKNKKRFIEKGE